IKNDALRNAHQRGKQTYEDRKHEGDDRDLNCDVDSGPNILPCILHIWIGDDHLGNQNVKDDESNQPASALHQTACEATHIQKLTRFSYRVGRRYGVCHVVRPKNLKNVGWISTPHEGDCLFFLGGKPAVEDFIPGAVIDHRLHGGVDGFNQIAAGREGEGETRLLEGFFKGDHATLCFDVAFSGGTVHHDSIHVIVEQRFDGSAEGVEAEGVCFTEEFVSGDFVGGADLRADEEVFQCQQFFGGAEAVFTLAHQQGFVVCLIEHTEIDTLVAFLGVGDAIRRHIDLTVGNRNQHAIPTHLDVYRHAVDASADFVERVVVPTDGFTRFV